MAVETGKATIKSARVVVSAATERAVRLKTAETALAGASIDDNSLARAGDELVRQYAVMAAANFADVDGIFEAVSEILLDQREDVDLRWNAFAFVQGRGNSTRTRAVVQHFQRDDAFGLVRRDEVAWNGRVTQQAEAQSASASRLAGVQITPCHRRGSATVPNPVP